MSHDHHAHAHSHGHNPAAADYGRAFAIGIGLNLAYVAAEAGYGLAAGSLALLADAGHNLGDVLGLGLSWGAAVLGRRGPSDRFTYGLRSSSILAALANALILLVVTGGIAWEAIRRLAHPVEVTGGTVAAVAAIGIVVNGATALLFARGRGGDLNLRSAFLHMAADAVVTAGVVIAGVAIALTGLLWLDPAMSLVVSAVIIYGTWDLVRQALSLALDAVPEGVDSGAVRAHLMAVPGVTALHDLHIWGMSTT
ncbi:MAG TPA: cation diffusion facilitator family transporter, partial [Stellaceae bacterium]|nr:cation diffusion facilitator family transporter [Stellaceae bacterium]